MRQAEGHQTERLSRRLEHSASPGMGQRACAWLRELKPLYLRESPSGLTGHDLDQLAGRASFWHHRGMNAIRNVLTSTCRAISFASEIIGYAVAHQKPEHTSGPTQLI